MNHGSCHGELLLHAVRIVGDQLLGLIGELHEVEQFGRTLGGGYSVEAVHAAREVEELRTGQATEQRHAFGDDADLPLHLNRIFLQIKAEDFDSPGAWREQPGEHFDGGGFARAVGAEEAKELSGGDAQFDIVDRN